MYEDLSLPMSLEEEIIIENTEPAIDTDEETIKSYFQEIDYYIKKDLSFNPLFLDTIFDLNLPFQKLEDYQPDFRNIIIRLINRVLFDFGLSLKANPVRWEIFSNIDVNSWLTSGGYNFITIERILAYLVLIGVKPIAMALLKTLLEIFKKNPDKISLEQFRKWNRLLAATRVY